MYMSDTTVTEVLVVGVGRADMQASNLLWAH